MVFVDDQATPEQYDALDAILSRRAGGPWERMARFRAGEAPQSCKRAVFTFNKSDRSLNLEVADIVSLQVDAIRGADRDEPVTISNLYNVIHGPEHVIARPSWLLMRVAWSGSPAVPTAFTAASVGATGNPSKQPIWEAHMRFKAKPLRSVMFVPGNREDWMRKAHQYGPDALILDLEDSVPEDEKEKARSLVTGMVDELGSAGQTLFVRVNRLETGLTGFDLEAVTSPYLYGILLPKVERPEDVVEVDTLLRFFERKAGMAIGSICIDPALETAHGIRQAYDIAMASDRVAHMGGSGGKGGDTARSIGFQWTPEGMETLFIKSKVLVDSRSAGIEFPISGGWFDIHDLDGLRDLANQLKQLGYTGMHLIHPSHVPVVNDVFTPGPEQIAHWKGLLKAMEEQRPAGSAVVTYAGDMVDIAHEETARTMLEMVRQWGINTEAAAD